MVAVENPTFYTDSGISPRGTLRALVNDVRGNPVQGGSTVTQQFVPPAGAGSPTRAEWLNLTQPSYLQPYCNFGGMNVDTTGGNATWARSRVGFLGNEAGDCTSPDSYMGLGNNGVTCGEPSYTVGNSAGSRSS